MKYLQIIFFFITWNGAALAEAPIANLKIELKTTNSTFNHVQDFTLYDGKLWYRLRYMPDNAWQEIPLKKLEGAKFQEIKADGANLMVSDSRGLIYYKKVLDEWRHHGEYKSRDIALKSSWIPFWFSVPFARLPQFLPIMDFHLRLPKGARSWAMSHRGTFNFYFEDIRGEQHDAFHMVTTAYAIPENGKDILFADPFLVGGFRRVIKGPHPNFIGDKIDASASMLFLVGDLNGETKYFTRLADFDTMGRNPILPGFWYRGAAGMTTWDEVTVPVLEGKGSLSKNITIFQTGVGNSARELRIEGKDQTGLAGFYRKSISDKDWAFVNFDEKQEFTDL